MLLGKKNVSGKNSYRSSKYQSINEKFEDFLKEHINNGFSTLDSWFPLSICAMFRIVLSEKDKKLIKDHYLKC